MKKIFTLIAVAAMAMSVNAQTTTTATWSAIKGETIANPDDDTKTVDLATMTGVGSPSSAFSAVDMTVEGENEGNGYIRFANNFKGGNTGVDMILYYPAVSKEPVTITWTATLAAGITFNASKIGLNAARVGTDGGKVTIKVKVDDNETTLIEDMIPARNNKESADDKHYGEEKFNAGRFEANVSGTATKSISVIAIGNELADNKQYAFGNIVITGTSNATTGINEVVTLNMSNAAAFNLAGQKVANDYKGLVIKNGKKVVIK